MGDQINNNNNNNRNGNTEGGENVSGTRNNQTETWLREVEDGLAETMGYYLQKVKEIAEERNRRYDEVLPVLSQIRAKHELLEEGINGELERLGCLGASQGFGGAGGLPPFQGLEQQQMMMGNPAARSMMSTGMGPSSLSGRSSPGTNTHPTPNLERLTPIPPAQQQKTPIRGKGNNGNNGLANHGQGTQALGWQQSGNHSPAPGDNNSGIGSRPLGGNHSPASDVKSPDLRIGMMVMSEAGTDADAADSDGAGKGWGTSWGVEGMHAGKVADLDVLGFSNGWVVASTAEDGSIFLHQANAGFRPPNPVCQSCFHLPDAGAKGTAVRLFQASEEEMSVPFVMTGDSHGTVCLWTVMGSLVRTFLPPKTGNGAIQSLDIGVSAAGGANRAAALTMEGEVCIWNLEDLDGATKEEEARWLPSKPGNPIKAVRFFGENEVATLGSDNRSGARISIWDLRQSGAKGPMRHVNPSPPRTTPLSRQQQPSNPNSSMVASSFDLAGWTAATGFQNEVTLCDLRSTAQEPLQRLQLDAATASPGGTSSPPPVQRGVVRCVALSPHEEAVACATSTGAILVWGSVNPQDGSSPRVVAEAMEHKAAVCSLRWRTQEAGNAGQNRLIVSGAEDDSFRAWAPPSGV